MEKITPMLSRKSSLEYALFIIDLDNFKEVNDNYGHLYGDAVLSMTAGCIKSSVGEDDIVGRFGGDEFFAFIKFAHEEDIAEIAERIMQSVFNLCRNIDKNIGCSCSIGIALRRDFLDDVDFDTLFKAADSALYSAKNSGKNRFKLYDTKNIEYEYARVHDINDSASVSSVTAMALEIIAKSKSSYSAVATLLSHIGTQCNLDYIQIMHVNRTTDMVSLDHEWSRNSNTVNYAGRIGYYIHSDIERLAELLRKTGFFIFSPDIAEGFSPKFKNEFKKLDGTTVIYSAVINNDDSFNMIVYQCFTPNLVWSDKEVNTFSELTNLLSFYIGDTNLLTGREKYLQDIIDHDPLTRLYSRKKFYDLSGLVRRQAAEKNTKIYIAHCDFADFIGFNEIYSYTTGN
ncbi:MAG: diguanylate cyclase [Oscillospiraceae bacterium]|nr:diguanylate cyclase [Oscillospiraceae bacterium]